MYLRRRLQGIRRRLLDSVAGDRSIKRDAPYRRLTKAGQVHRPVLLNIETSDGSGQACHPDVVYIAEGFGRKKWAYWMVCTPYPYKENRVENPEIFASHDGIFWSVPDGAQNPVVPAPRVASDHNSDPDMLFHEDQLWLFYRETLKSKEPGKTADTNNIYLMKSKDGVQWSPVARILSEATGRQLLSPAVIHDGDGFQMWTVEVDGGELKLERRRSTDGVNWSVPQAGKVIGLEAGRQPWHIDVIREKDRFSAALVSCTGLGGSGTRIHYAHSEDGLTWFAGRFLLEQAYEFEANLQYRASLRKAGDQPPEYELWYSASSMTDVFSIAYVRLVREQNRLIPALGSCSWARSTIDPSERPSDSEFILR